MWTDRDELERAARAAAGGYRQAEWVEQMLDGGCRGQFTGRWAASQYRSLQALRRRLSQWGVRTEHLAVGPRGGRMWVISPVRLTPNEMRAWAIFGSLAEARLAEAAAAGLSDLDIDELLVECQEGGGQERVRWTGACSGRSDVDSGGGGALPSTRR